MSSKDGRILKFLRREDVKFPPNVISAKTLDNDTWHTCPKCGMHWQGDSIPGILHQTTICVYCKGVQ